MISQRRLTAALLGAGAMLWFSVGSAWGQGCIVGRSCSPGAISGADYLPPHQYDIAFDYRGFTAKKHYNGTVEQVQRETRKTFVINRQNIFDLTGTFGVTRQASVYVDVPYIHSGWSVPLPQGNAVTPPGPRYQQNAAGLGDISVGVKFWAMDTDRHPNENVALSVGVKLPTGKDDARSDFPDLTGANLQSRVVDQSIQPGDGSFGFPLSLQAFATVKQVNFFATGNYLVSPRDTNGVPSILTTLGVTPSPQAPSQNVNSVPDQYLIRIGVGTAIRAVPGLSAAIAWRKEGVPAHDFIGADHGWRRPGFSTSIEPTVSYAHNGTTYTVSVPLTQTRDRLPTVSDGVALPGDSTFADSQFIFNVTHRFGG